MKTEWFYCPRCQRAFPSDVPDDYRPGQIIIEIGQGCLDEDGEDWWYCPYEDCNASTIESLHWSKIRLDHPDLPEIPEQGRVYC